MGNLIFGLTIYFLVAAGYYTARREDLKASDNEDIETEKVSILRASFWPAEIGALLYIAMKDLWKWRR